MTQSSWPSNPVPPRASAPFAERPASPTWEQIALPDPPGSAVWVWFKPPTVPHGLLFHIPAEMFPNMPHPEQLTLRRLLHAAGVEPCEVALWQLYGYAYDAALGTSPLLDQPIPKPPTGADPTIVVYMHAAPAPWSRLPVCPDAAADSAWQSGNPSAGQAGSLPYGQGGNATYGQAGSLPYLQAAASLQEMSLVEMFERIDADWTAILQIEQELSRVRKQLVDMLGRLKTLNRDLTATERLHSSPQDQKDWQDARRWLRDVSTQLSVCVREHDIGDTSAAGKRNWFEQIYEQFVIRRQGFDGIQQAQRDYETHRKMIQTLHIGMNSAYQNAALNGERRAQQVLTRIAAKVREATTKRNILGVMLD